MQRTFAVSALVASSVNARRQAVTLAITCSRILEAITWDLQRLPRKEELSLLMERCLLESFWKVGAVASPHVPSLDLHDKSP